MSFPRYPKYKASGVEWLGELPVGWITCALKRLVRMQSGESITAESIAESGAYPVYGGNGLRGFTSEFTHNGTYVLIGRQGALCGNINYAFGEFWASEHAVVVTPTKPVNTFWLGEMLRAMNLNQYSIAAAQPGLSVELVGRLGIPVPPLPEQTAIAAFLDHETAKIDALVAEQERLIELLKEKRQAVISHAVTKGLNPDAPMKDSGIEWLGEVPEHWKVVAIKWLSPVRRGASPRPIDDPKYFDEEGEFAWVRIADVSACDGVLNETTQQLSQLGSSLSVKILPGELFVSIAGTVGKPCMSAIKACIHDGFVYFPALKIEPRFLYRIFEGGDCYGGLGKWGTQLNLNTDTVGSIRVALPPEVELNEVLEFLDHETAKFTTLTTEANRVIDLLKERRTALISAAVTGQIDVRNLVSVESA